MDQYILIGMTVSVVMLRSMVSLIFEHPLDAIKTYWQAHPSHPSLGGILKEIYGLKGWKGFYSGAVPNTLRILFKQSYRYPLMVVLPLFYGYILDSLIMISALTGITIAVIEVFFITPLERLKVWLITFPDKYGGIQSFADHLKNKGLSTLYQGLSVVAARQVLSWVSFLVIHDQGMQLVHASSKMGYVIWMMIGISLLEGGINTLVTLPMDTLKTHIQKINPTSGDYMTMIYIIYCRYGIKGFYVGWHIRFIQYLIHSVFLLSIVEKFKV